MTLKEGLACSERREREIRDNIYSLQGELRKAERSLREVRDAIEHASNPLVLKQEKHLADQGLTIYDECKQPNCQGCVRLNSGDPVDVFNSDHNFNKSGNFDHN
jgi:hypothetical protein